MPALVELVGNSGSVKMIDYFNKKQIEVRLD